MIFQNHLAEKGFIHRDLAARNILVGSNNRVKVSDFELMRQIYEEVYSGKNANKLPAKWMAHNQLMTASTPSRVMCKSIFLCDSKAFSLLLRRRSTTSSFEDLVCIIES